MTAKRVGAKGQHPGAAPTQVHVTGTMPAAVGREEGLTHVDLVADADNRPSQKVIESNGGRLIEQFRKPAAYGNKESLRYRIRL